MEWLKTEKLKYLQNGASITFPQNKKILTCASDNTFWEVIVF